MRSEIALRIDYDRIHIVSFHRMQKSLKVINNGTYEAPSNFVRDQKLDWDWLVRKIDDFIARTKGKPKKFHLTLPHLAGLHMARVLETKNVLKKDLKRFVPFLIEDQFNAAITEEYEYRWKSLSSRFGHDRILVTLLQKKMAHELRTLFEEKGWELRTIESDILSYSRVIPERMASGTTAVMDFSPRETRVATYLNRELLNLETIVNEKGSLIHNEGGEVFSYSPVPTESNTYLDDVRQALFQLKFKDQTTFDAVYLIYAEEHSSFLFKLLENDTETPFAELGVPSNIRLNPENPFPSTYLSAVGLALKGDEDPYAGLNFTGNRWLSKKSIRMSSNTAIVVSLSAFLLTQTMGVLSNAQVEAMRKENTSLENAVATMQTENSTLDAELQNYKLTLDGMRQTKVVLEEFKSKEEVGFPNSEIIEDLARNTTENTVIDSINISIQSRALTLVAHTYSYKELGYFIIATKRIGVPNLVRLEKVADANGDDVYNFELHITEINIEGPGK